MDDKDLEAKPDLGPPSAGLILFVRIFLADFQPSDLQRLSKLDKIGSDRVPAEELLEAVADGRLAAWRIGDRGLLLTSIRGDILIINGLTGSGLIPHASAIFERLQVMRNKAGCRTIQGEVSRPGLRRLYEALGLRTVAHIMEI